MATLSQELDSREHDADLRAKRVVQGFEGRLVQDDTAVKIGAGFLHSLTFSQNDAAPTAGTIYVYDTDKVQKADSSPTASSSPSASPSSSPSASDSPAPYTYEPSDRTLFVHTFTTTAFVPFTVNLDVRFYRGLYIRYEGPTDVNITVSYS